jgi:hypothetical protein
MPRLPPVMIITWFMTREVGDRIALGDCGRQ